MEFRKVVKNYVPALVLGFAVFAVGPGYYGAVEAADWSNWRGPNHNGISNETGWVATWPEAGPKVLWEKSLGTGFASMAVSKGRVYAMGNIKDNDILYCLDADTGKEIWKKSYPCPLFKKDHEGGPCATPTVDGDSVYTFSKNGDAVRFRAATGEVVWHKKLNKDLGFKHPTWYFASSPFIIDNMVILNAGTNGVALNKADGSVIWQNGKGAAGYSTAVPFTMDGQRCVAIFSAKEMVALVAETGKILWKIPWKTSYDVNAADAIITGDKIFLSSGYNKGCALFKIGSSDFTELWRNKNMRNHFNSCVLWKGYIYGVDETTVKCLDFKTGQEQWSQKGFGKGSLMLSDEKLIILSDKGKLAIAEASPTGFRQLSSAQILPNKKCWTVPVLANGRIYARNNPDGRLVCLDVRGKD
ncbi:MAG TPA: PQQ-binding-like beta-propeller repeat protein [Sedimentisphaerales bacterium]|nr:PQQ-binding-like beta-propeller repeat protein [Sedimentisphaerales bacterium]